MAVGGPGGRPCRGWQGRVWGGVVLGRNGTGAVPAGGGVAWARAGGRERPGRALVGWGGFGAGTRASCSTAGRPAEHRLLRAGEGVLVRGVELGSIRVAGAAPGQGGVLLCCWFGTSGMGGGHLHAIGVLGLGLGHGDAWACPEGAGECWVGAGHEGDKGRASVGCHLNKRVVVSFCTICHY